MKAKEALKQYALLLENQAGHCSIHRLVQLAVRSKQDKDMQTGAQIKGMSALAKIYVEEDPTLIEMQQNKQLLVHGENLLAYVDQGANDNT